jgi:hypothetical protein
MRRQGLAHRLVGDPGCLLARPADGAGDQPLLDRQQLGGGPAALLQRPVSDHTDRPLGHKPVGQLLQLSSSGASQAGAQGDQDIGAGEGGRVRGQPLRASQPVEQPTGHRIGHRLVLVAVGCPAGHLPQQGVRVHASFGRLLTPPSIQGVRRLVLLRLPRRVHGPLDQPRRPLSTVRGALLRRFRVESRPVADLREAGKRSNRRWRFLSWKRLAIWRGTDRSRSTADRMRDGWRATERWDDPRRAGARHLAWGGVLMPGLSLRTLGTPS